MVLVRTVLLGTLLLAAGCHRRGIARHPVPAETLTYLRSLGCGDTTYAREMLVHAELQSEDPRLQAAARDGRWPNPVELGRATPRYALTDPAECTAMLERYLRRTGGTETWRPIGPFGHPRVVRFALVRLGAVDLIYTRHASQLATQRPNGTTDTTTTNYDLHLYLERDGKRGSGFLSP